MANCSDDLLVGQQVALSAIATREIHGCHMSEEGVVNHYLPAQIVSMARYAFGNRAGDMLSARNAGRIGWNQRCGVTDGAAFSNGTGRGYIGNGNKQNDE